MQSRLKSKSSMSNTGYHQNGKPIWWARIGQGDNAKFINIPDTRGDRQLNCVVDLPPGTIVHIGAGKGEHKTIREIVTTEEVK